jgi:hypothetical protein
LISSSTPRYLDTRSRRAFSRRAKTQTHSCPTALVEVPSSRLSFSAGCSPNPPHFREQSLAMPLNCVGTVTIKCTAQLPSDVLNVQVQLLNPWASFWQHPAVERLLLMSSIRDSSHLPTLAPASSRLLFSSCSLLLLRSSITRPSQGSLSFGLPWRSSPWWSGSLLGLGTLEPSGGTCEPPGGPSGHVAGRDPHEGPLTNSCHLSSVPLSASQL